MALFKIALLMLGAYSKAILLLNQIQRPAFVKMNDTVIETFVLDLAKLRSNGFTSIDIKSALIAGGYEVNELKAINRVLTDLTRRHLIDKQQPDLNSKPLYYACIAKTQPEVNQVLSCLDSTVGKTAIDISNQLHLDKKTVNRTLYSLQKQGLINSLAPEVGNSRPLWVLMRGGK